MIKFSITIPSYKKKFLAEAIDSVLAQTYKNFELIIVDDNSPEDLYELVSKYTDNRIQYFRNERNCGAINVVDNWNICLGYCVGDYVICMGDDDRLLPCCLEEYAKLIEKYPNLNVFHAWTQLIDEWSNLKEVLEPRPEFESFFSMTYYRWKGRRQYIGDFCFKIDHLRKNHGFYKLRLAWGSDDISAARAALKKGIANTPQPCFEYRQSGLTISNGTNHTMTKLESSLRERIWYESVFKEYEDTLLNDVDKWYFEKLKKIAIPCSVLKMIDEILLEVRYNPFKMIKWLKICQKYEIPRRYLIGRYVEFCFWGVVDLLK